MIREKREPATTTKKQEKQWLEKVTPVRTTAPGGDPIVRISLASGKELG